MYTPPSRYRRRRLNLLIALVGLLAYPFSAHAELGGFPRTMGTRFTLTQTIDKVSSFGTVYQVRQETDANFKVQWTEYIVNNTVFAIDWSGSQFPELSEALGARCYADYLQDLTTRQPGDHHHSISTTPSCTLYSNGRAGRFSGRAVIPALVPLGLDPQSFQ